MALPNEHQLKFNSYKNAKSLMEAIEKRFGGNKESKKVHKILLKQQYENFNRKSSKGLDQIYDRLQKLISQLEIHGETISQKDVNMKLLRIEIMGSSSTNQNTQNVAFVSSNITSSTNEAIKTAHGVSTANSKNNASTLPNVDSLSDDDMDLKWQMAMLTMRASRFLKKTRRNLGVNGTDTIGFDKTKVECYNCHKRGHFARECRAPRNQDSRNREITRMTVPVKETTSNTLVFQYDGFGYDWSDQAEEGPTNLALMVYTSSGSSSSSSSDTEARLDVYKKNEAVFEEDIKILKLTLEKFKNSSKNLSKLLDSQVSDKFKTGVGYDSQVYDSQVFDSQENDMYKIGEGYHAVPPPYTGNFMPPKPDLVLADEYGFSNENENETESKSRQRKPSNAKVEFVKTNEHVKSPRESVKKVKNNKKAKYPRKNSQSPRGNKRNWNNLMTQKLESKFEFKNKACYVCGRFNHLIKDCDFYEKKIMEKPVWNNARRVNHKFFQRMTPPHPKRNFVPRAVLIKSGLKTLNTTRQNSSRAAVSVNTARPINTAYPGPIFTMNKNNNFKEKVNTVRENVTTVEPKAVVSDNKGNEANVVKASACWVGRPDQKVLDHGNPQLELQEKGVIDSGCSRHMIGNKSYLSDYEEINGGFVAFGGNPKGGKITRKGKIRTGKLVFEDLYFVKELKFNLFSVSQMCDKKNNVLFTDTECVVLSPYFKLLDESQVLLRVPRKNNMYSVALNNVVPLGCLTCL
ncbi:ribonuclease H-like domain-containing protein, partial [Tanacetum coccineum]